MHGKQNIDTQLMQDDAVISGISWRRGRVNRHAVNTVLVMMIFPVVAWFASLANAQKINCQATENRVEETICEDTGLLGLDAKMDVLYQIVINNLEYASDTVALDRVKAEQDKWLKDVRDVCSNVNCIIIAYNERNGQLQKEDSFSVPASKLISKDEYLAKIDREMEWLYTTAIDALNDNNETKAIDRIKDEQRLWLEKVRNVCRDAECLKAAYEPKRRKLNDEKRFSFSASNMAYMLKTCLSVSSPSEAERVKAEHEQWLKEVRTSCQDITCLEAAYTVQESHLKREAEKDIWQFWDTDGYWYFYNKGRCETSSCTLAYYSSDGSDVLLRPSPRNAGNIWVNAFRFASEDELSKKMSLGTSFATKQPLCNGNTVDIHDRAGYQMNRVVIRTPQQANEPLCEDCLSFALIRDITPPEIINGLLHETHQDEDAPLKLPILSAVSNVQVMPDCTILAEISEGLIRFRQDGTTDAKLPSGMRLIDGKLLLQWSQEFYRSFTGEGDMSLEPELWYIHNKIFGEEKQ